MGRGSCSSVTLDLCYFVFVEASVCNLPFNNWNIVAFLREYIFHFRDKRLTN